MTSEKILYTDGHEVIVTDSFFKVKKALYQLNGITNHKLFVIHPHRVSVFLLMLSGIILLITGITRLAPPNLISGLEDLAVQINRDKLIQVTPNDLAIALGTGLVLISLVALKLKKDRYAIRIATAEGEKDVVISSPKEYITQIIDALNKAFLNLIPAGR